MYLLLKIGGILFVVVLALRMLRAAIVRAICEPDDYKE